MTGEVREINSDAVSAAEVVVVQADRRAVIAGHSTNPVAPETRIVDPARPAPASVMTAAEAVVAEAIDRIVALVRRDVVVAMTVTAAAVVVAATVTDHVLSRLPLP